LNVEVEKMTYNFNEFDDLDEEEIDEEEEG
jgi:hypothetical protein